MCHLKHCSTQASVSRALPHGVLPPYAEPTEPDGQTSLHISHSLWWQRGSSQEDGSVCVSAVVVVCESVLGTGCRCTASPLSGYSDVAGK